MSARRHPGKIIDSTTLIDFGMYGIAGAGAVYLIQDEMTCLIDSGTRSEAPRLVKTLRKLNAFPPDIVILTHAHYDHAQGIPLLRKEAAREKKGFDVLASARTIPLLADENYNKDFDHGPYARIENVIPIKDGDRINIGAINLRVFDLPGHASDQIGILDEKNANLFAADAVGNKISDGLFLPPFMPPAWDPDDFLNTIEKLKRMDYKSLSLSHFGYIYGDEARDILDETLSNTRIWWSLFEENEDNLDDSQYMVELIKQEIEPLIPQIRVLSRKNRILLGLMNNGRKFIRKDPINLGDKVLSNVIEQLAAGYRIYRKRLVEVSS